MYLDDSCQEDTNRLLLDMKVDLNLNLNLEQDTLTNDTGYTCKYFPGHHQLFQYDNAK